MSGHHPYEVTLTVSGVKEEHIAWTARALYLLAGLFRLDGADVSTSVSVQHPGQANVEHVYKYLPSDEEA